MWEHRFLSRQVQYDGILKIAQLKDVKVGKFLHILRNTKPLCMLEVWGSSDTPPFCIVGPFWDVGCRVHSFFIMPCRLVSFLQFIFKGQLTIQGLMLDESFQVVE